MIDVPVHRIPLLLALLASLGAGGCSTDNEGELPVGRIKHVFVVVLENENYDSTFAEDSAAPYLSQTLAAQGLVLRQYTGVAHFSLPNYIAMISGQAPSPATQGDCQTFSDFVSTAPLDADGQAIGNGCVYPSEVKTLADQLVERGLRWRGYMEDMGNGPDGANCRHPAVGAMDTTQHAEVGDQYAARHNPFVYFHSIIDTPDCAANDVPLTQLDADLASADAVAEVSFITPNLCNDGHDEPCVSGEPGGLVTADAFLQSVIPKILASPAYADGGLVIITFDEAEIFDDQTACCDQPASPNVMNAGLLGPGGGRIGAVLLSPLITPGTESLEPYNHFSLLRTIEDLYRLPHLGFAGRSGLKPFGRDVFPR